MKRFMVVLVLLLGSLCLPVAVGALETICGEDATTGETVVIFV